MKNNSIYIFDLDGVITKTEEIHYRCWKETFEEIYQPFEFTREMYIKYFDGVSRTLAINNFVLENKNFNYEIKKIEELKNKKYLVKINKEEIQNIQYKDAEVLIKKLIENGNKIGLATSSKNSRIILGKLDYIKIFDYMVDGNDLEKMKLKSKPYPDIFNYCINKLRKKNKNEEIIIIEDSVSGVNAALDSIADKVIWIQRNKFNKSTEYEIKTKGKYKLKIVQTLKDEL